jgi:hypothetical protein
MHKSFANLANTMVVGNGAPTEHDLITCCIFHELIGMYDLIRVETLMV